MSHIPEHIRAVTTHKRRGAIGHVFTYGVDYVLVDPNETVRHPKLFSRNRFNLNSVHDVDHGGPLKTGKGLTWVNDVLVENGLNTADVQIYLLTQPRFLTYGFNPVSFWLVQRADDLIAVIAEVSTPFAQRHSYLCHLDGFAPITKESRMHKPKLLHVSPFQDVAGDYEFIFDIDGGHIDIRILYRNGQEGVTASLQGLRTPMTNWSLMKAGVRRPLGALRTMILIHWQALRLKLKGAHYRSSPTPPTSEVS